MRMFVSRSLASTFLGILLLVFALCVSGCQEEGAARSGKGKTEHAEQPAQREEFPNGHYWLNVKVDQFKGSYTLLCNGFPVKKMWVNIVDADDEWAADMQTALIGEGNVASMRIRPFLDYSGRRLSVGTVQLKAWVEIEETRQSYVPLHKIKGAEGEGRLRAGAVDSAYADWKQKVQKQWKRLLKEKPTPKKAFIKLKTWRWENPMEVKTTLFTNRAGPDFSRIFEEAPRLPDTPATRERLKDYAMHLRDLFAQKDTAALYREHKLSFQSNDSSKEKALNVIGTNWLKYDWHTGFGREDLTCRRWSDGRVWEIYRDDELSDRLSKQALFLAGEDRLTGWHKVYVAEIDGELKVVR